jgi:hypothetical protein
VQTLNDLGKTIPMRYRHSGLVILAAAALACSGDPGTTEPAPPPPPPVLLKEIVIPNLPSPYYHFEYDMAGRVSTLSFASQFFTYDVGYDSNGRISEMRNITVATGTRLDYVYDDAGRVGAVKYVDSNGATFTVLFFSYDGQKLTGIERDRRVEGGFIIDKTVSLSYYPDGNLRELTEHRPAIEGQQDASTTVDRFEQYDDRINVDGFSLIHDEFFDHKVLLPGAQLQKGNPARQTHSGDGVNYRVDFTYTYDDRRRPLTKSGELTFLNGPDAGRTFQTSEVLSYY